MGGTVSTYGSSDDAHILLAGALDSTVERLTRARIELVLTPSLQAAVPGNGYAAGVDQHVANAQFGLSGLLDDLRDFSSLTHVVGISYRAAESAIENGFRNLVESISYILGILSRPLVLSLLGVGAASAPLITLLNQLSQNPAVQQMLQVMLAPVTQAMEQMLNSLISAYGPYVQHLLTDPTVLDLLGYGTHGIDDFLTGLLGVVPLNALDDRDAVTLLTMLVLPLVANGHKLGSNPVVPRNSTAEEQFGALPEGPISGYSEGFEQIISQNSDIVIYTYELPDGSLHYQVFVRGTQDWSFGDGKSGFDSISNFENAASHRDLYGTANGLEQALLDAGIPPGASLDLFGYSQGGAATALVAANGTFEVQSLTTYGAPSGFVDMPEGIDWVQLQNDSDIVPNVAGMSQHDTDAMLIEMSPDIHPQSFMDPHLAPAYQLALKELEESGDTVALGQANRRRDRLDGAQIIDQTAYELDRH